MRISKYINGSAFSVSVCLLLFAQTSNAQTPSPPPESIQPPPVSTQPPPAQQGFEHEGYDNTSEESQEAVIARPNMITLEFLGRSLVYSLDYDRRISEHWAIGLGISTWQATVRWANYQASVTVIPIYANYYFSELPSRGFLTGGFDIIQNSNPGFDSSTFASNGGAGLIGGGYEMRDPSGFTIRLGGDLIIGRSVLINPSMSVGLAF